MVRENSCTIVVQVFCAKTHKKKCASFFSCAILVCSCYFISFHFISFYCKGANRFNAALYALPVTVFDPYSHFLCEAQHCVIKRVLMYFISAWLQDILQLLLVDDISVYTETSDCADSRNGKFYMSTIDWHWYLIWDLPITTRYVAAITVCNRFHYHLLSTAGCHGSVVIQQQQQQPIMTSCRREIPSK